MMRDYVRRPFIALTLLFLYFFSDAQAGTLRIPLLDATEVHGDVILLADLLPKDVPRFLREAAGKVSLGMAPQNGTSRRLSRLSVLAAVMANGFQASEFQIPESMTVQRASHSVTREEAFDAIRLALLKSNDLAVPDFLPEDLSFSAVQLPNRASQLAVTDFAFDEFIGRARFRLSSLSAPDVHPFYVTAQFSSRLAAAQSAFILGRNASPVATSELSPVLVKPGRLARLRLHSSNSNIFLQVQPLQPGHLGEVIRVRMPSNGKTLRARVLEGGALDAAL
jgi:hypothetical protein